jgi:hypothetical protein
MSKHSMPILDGEELYTNLPTPLHASPAATYDEAHEDETFNIFGANGQCIATGMYKMEANDIIKACNERAALVARVQELEHFVTNITEHGYYYHPLIEGDEAVALKETLSLLERDARALMLMPRPLPNKDPRPHDTQRPGRSEVSETVKRYWFPSETTGMLEVAFVLASDYDTILRSHQDLERRLKEAETRADALSETILWALGERDEFPSRPEDWNERKYKPWYWWRGELRKRFDTAMGKEPG